MKYSTARLQRNKTPWGCYLAGIALALLASLAGILLGATRIPLSQLGAHWFLDTPQGLILRHARLPRVVGSLLCGSALAVSGAVIQGVLANRLASPSTLGVNAGAALGVTLGAALGVAGGWGTALGAFLGAFGAVMAVSLGAKKWGASRGTVILMGVAMNSLLGAISDTVVTLVPEVNFLRTDFRIGDLSGVTLTRLIPAGAVILAALVLAMTLTNELEVLSLGEDNARALGMRTDATRTALLLLAAALAGAAVSLAGLLSFVGLLVPHGVRRVAGNRARHLLPLCALFGGGFVTLCDTLSRVAFAPYELPVGIFMAFLGAPFFLYVLFHGRGGHHG